MLLLALTLAFPPAAVELAGGVRSGTFVPTSSDETINKWSGVTLASTGHVSLGGPWRVGVGGGYQYMRYSPETSAKVYARVAEAKLFLGLAFPGEAIVDHGPRIGAEWSAKSNHYTYNESKDVLTLTYTSFGFGVSYVVAVRLLPSVALFVDGGVRYYPSTDPYERVKLDVGLLVGLRYGSTGP